MKLTVSLVCLFSTIGLLTKAAPTDEYARHGHGDNTQADASKQIDRWQKGYNDYVQETLQTHKKGCTLKNILQRQEW